jgi:hypothetical protein
MMGISYTFKIKEEDATAEEDGETIIPDIFNITGRASAVGYEPEPKNNKI